MMRRERELPRVRPHFGGNSVLGGRPVLYCHIRDSTGSTCHMGGSGRGKRHSVYRSTLRFCRAAEMQPGLKRSVAQTVENFRSAATSPTRRLQANYAPNGGSPSQCPSGVTRPEPSIARGKRS
jgi:hypothetical protein